MTCAACDGDGSTTYVDEGRICLETETLAQFDPGDVLTLTYTADECISACPRFAEAACEAEMQGNRIIVRSEARWAPSDEVCIAVCAALQAQCTVSVPAEGEYTLVHGADELTVVLPAASEEPACTDPAT